MELRPCKRKATLTTVKQEEGESKAEEEEQKSRLSCVMDEVLVEILMRLPSSKSAIQCKPVCKRWNSLIYSSYFITRYTTHHGASNSFTVIFKWKKPAFLKHLSSSSPSLMLRQCLPGVLAFPTYPRPMVKTNLFRKKITDNVSRSTAHHLNLEFLEFPPSDYRIRKEPPLWVQAESSCHDLLLLSRFGVYYVVNPLTRRSIVIPIAPSCSRGEVTVFGAGLLSKWDHRTSCFRFKVIRIPIFPTDPHYIVNPFLASAVDYRENLSLSDDDEFPVHIFCSESKQWTEHIVKWYPFRLTRYIINAPIISHNGMLHWLNGRSIVSLNPFELVVDGDGHLKLSRMVDLPSAQGYSSGASCLLGFGVTGGHLRVIIDHRVFQRALYIWELDERENGGSWHLVHQVFVSSLPFKWGRICFLSFQPYDGNIFFLHVKDVIYSINLRSGITKHVALPTPPTSRSRGYRQFTTGLPPLLHQVFPTPLP